MGVKPKAKNACILVFAQDAHIVEEALSQKNYRFHLTTDENEALESYQTGENDLFILDTISILQKINLSPQSNILFIGDTKDIDAALAAGVNDCYIGSLTEKLFTQRVANLVRTSTNNKKTKEEYKSHYRSLFEGANDGILLIDAQSSEIIEANPEAARMLGYTREELRGVDIQQLEYIPERKNKSRSDDMDATNHLIVEALYRRHDGSMMPIETSSRLMNFEGRPTIVSFLRDVSDRRRAFEAELAQRKFAEALLDSTSALNTQTELEAVLDSILRNVIRVMPVEHANIMLLEGEQVRIVRHYGYSRMGIEANSLENLSFDVNLAPNLVEIIENKRPHIVHDTSAAGFKWATSTTANLVQSILTAPILLGENLIGFINLDSSRKYHFRDEHAYQLQAFANQAAVAILNARLFAQIQQQMESLEGRVMERTQALSNANEELQETQVKLAEERTLLRTIIDTIPDAIYVKDLERRFLVVNATTLSNMPITDPNDIIGKTDEDFYSKEDAGRFLKDELKIMATGNSHINQQESFIGEDGNWCHLLVTKLPLRDSEGNIVGLIGINHDITNLKQAEEQLEQVLRSAHCLLWSATVEKTNKKSFTWEIRVANEDAAQLFMPLNTKDRNYTEAWLDAISAVDKPKRSKTLQDKLKKKQKSCSQEFRISLKDGTERWLAEDVSIHPAGENRWYLVGVCTDISERKDAERRLHDLNDELEKRVKLRTQELTQANTELTQEVAERKRAEDAERQQRILADTLRDNVAKISSTLDREEVFKHLLTAIKSLVPYDGANIMLIEGQNIKIVHASGYKFDAVNKVYPIEEFPELLVILDNGDPFYIPDTSTYKGWKDIEALRWVKSNLSIPIKMEGTIIGFLNLDSAKIDGFTDEQAQLLVTFASQAGIAIRNARYTAELEKRVQERTQELESETAQLQAILNAMRDGVIYSNMQREVQYINQALPQMTGYSEDDWLNNRVGDNMQLGKREERAKFRNKLAEILTQEGFWREEMPLQRPDGTGFESEITRTLVKNKSDENIGTVTVVRDISDEKILEEQKLRFIATAAHELRNPIAALKTQLYLIRNAPSDKTEKYISTSETVVNLMYRLVEDMFDIGRFERGTIKLDREDLILQDLIAEVIQFQQPEAERQSITLEAVMPEPDIAIYADPYRLTQIIINLLSNALRHTPVDGSVTVKLEQDKEDLFLNVIDTGAGIAEEHQKHLFEPFYQATKDKKGAGLGLAIVQEIVNLHGGEISVNSTVGKGSTFSVKLPLAKLLKQNEDDEELS